MEFPLRATFKNHIEYELQLHFVDRDGRGWLMDEAGKLRRQREPIGIAPFSGVTTGQQGEVIDHSAAVSSNGQAVELAGMPIARLDFDAADGNNVSSLFLPKGQTMPSGSIVELRRDDGSMAARVFLDEQFKILKITICNLPKDTRHFAFPRYYRTDEAFHVLLGRQEDSLDELVNGKYIKETEILGGKHVPGGELAQVAYDDVGHLAAISVNNNKLVAGFLQD